MTAQRDTSARAVSWICCDAQNYTRSPMASAISWIFARVETKFSPNDTCMRLKLAVLIPLSHLPAIGRRPLCALGLWPFSPKRSENAEKCSPHCPLTRSHCNHLRSQCDFSTLSTQVCYVLYAITASKSPSLHFRYVYMGYSATSSVSF